MKKTSLDSPRARARLAVALAVGALGLLGIVFFRTQVLGSGADVLVQQGNRLRALPLPAARGPILDRNGVLLAGSDSGTALVLMPAPPDSTSARLRRIARLLELPHGWLGRAEQAARAASRPLIVTTDLDPADVVMLAARQSELPGVLLEPWPRRTYPGGPAIASVVGRIGLAPWPRGSGEDLVGAQAGRAVGRGGLELAFDSMLAGTAGLRYVEMDGAGGIVTDPTRPPYRIPVAGAGLRTHLDVALQRHIAALFSGTSRGAAMVVETATGHVLALYAHAPVAGVGGAVERAGNAAVAVPAPPGAAFHPITAALAMEGGHIDLGRPQAIPCRGGMRYGNRYFRCWNPAGHGQLALEGAIREGCDVYFYQITLRLGLQALLQAGTRFGLGHRTGIELPAEEPGGFPASVADLAGRLGRAPNPSDALELGTGQGFNQLTLVRLTHAYAALGNGGGSPAPRLTDRLPADVPWRLALRPEQSAELLAMLAGVTAPGGPASEAGRVMTAGTRLRGQVSRARAEAGSPRPAGWFVGLAGREGEPDRLAVGVLLERAPSDEAPAVLAGLIADWYLRNAGGAAVPADPDTTTASSTTVSSI